MPIFAGRYALRDDPTQIHLYPVITSIIERFQHNTGLAVEFRRPVAEPALPFDALRHLGYIIEEALINIWKHARANRGWVEVTQSDDAIQVVIGDDGIGFDPVTVAAWPAGSRGWGLQNIAERAVQMGGVSTIHAAPGQGTRRLPCPCPWPTVRRRPVTRCWRMYGTYSGSDCG
ncbi:MAG: ATP-binding protein [Anaerolineae bacterium]|nr:MAG: ATP-binding protein [Anaerolineae bacterium]